MRCGWVVRLAGAAALLVNSLMSAACASTPKAWYKADFDQTQFNADRSYCMQEGQMWSGGGDIAGVVVGHKAFNDCMERHGYQLVDAPPIAR